MDPFIAAMVPKMSCMCGFLLDALSMEIIFILVKIKPIYIYLLVHKYH